MRIVLSILFGTGLTMATAWPLGEVAKYYRAHGFVRIPTNIYSNLSQGIELLFLYAFSFGKHSAAALVHFALFVCVTFLILSYGRRIGRPAVGVAGALFFYVSPGVARAWSIASCLLAVSVIRCWSALFRTDVSG